MSLSGCDPSFQPLETNNEFFFSMYGYLDASADTQWVHVTPVREQIDELADGSGIRVTIQNGDSSQETVMNDSLFQRGRNFLNFWTNVSIEYNQTYYLKAELQSGETSEVTVITPEEMPTPILAIITEPGVSPKYFILVDSQVNLADIQTKYYLRILAPNFEAHRTITFAYRNLAEISEDFPGFYSVQIKPNEEIAEIERQILLPPEGKIEVVYRQIYAASSGIELDEEIDSLDDITYALPHTLRNVEMGLGYVIGIDSKYIPYAGCYDEDGFIISCGEEDPYWW